MKLKISTNFSHFVSVLYIYCLKLKNKLFCSQNVRFLQVALLGILNFRVLGGAMSLSQFMLLQFLHEPLILLDQFISKWFGYCFHLVTDKLNSSVQIYLQ